MNSTISSITSWNQKLIIIIIIIIIKTSAIEPGTITSMVQLI